MSESSDSHLADDAQVQKLGYEQELQRNHNRWSLLGFAFIILNTWTGMSASLSLALPLGGPSVVLWGLLVSSIGNGCLALSMAEFASAYPIAAGQYYWVAILSNPEWASLLSWMCGWINVIGWVFLIGLANSFSAFMIGGIAAMMNPGYVPKDWHYFLVYLALIVPIFCINAFGNALLPLLNKTALVWSLLGFVVISITALACATPDFQTASFVFGGVINSTQWPTGLAWMIGLLQGTLSLVGYDAPSHLAEEIPNPSKNVPRTMVGSVIIGTFSGFLFCIALLFAIQDIDKVLTAPEGPVLHILSVATGSRGAAVALIIFPLFCLVLGTTAIMTTASRLVWAFARDGGLPLSPWLSQVQRRLGVPLNALISTLGVVVLYGLLFFAGQAALNALVGASVVSSLLSYAFPVAVNMAGGRKRLPKDRPFRMYELVAWVVNAIGVGFTLLTTVLFCLPPAGPAVGRQTFNYTVVAFGLVLVVALGDYLLDGKRRYKGPRIPVTNSK
ncbi:amino acid permease [Sphaerosporella brunnea]|uniref:Amino acid permease n=1 Tax=Sphaerosporella brunnea TaxID=1250544 RepID=A0A5J5EZJ9_9PEZI|nr:amino acid permease [Sphaerosporella brunnea]